MMNPPQVRAGAPASISVIGAGIAGTWQALMFAKAGCKVALYERSDPSLTQATGLTRARTCGGQRCFAANGGGGAIEYLSGLCGCRTLRVRVISPSSWQPGLAVVFRRRGVPAGVVGGHRAQPARDRIDRRRLVAAIDR